jgi:UDP-N-acetylmuramoyl-L-alanyl-D-glutamate--2,6-diaminopimelate ligase
MVVHPLDQLLAGITVADEVRGMPVRGLALDSRRVRPGEVFVALRGGTRHGIEFVEQAWAHGAVAVLAEGPPLPSAPSARMGPILWIDELRTRIGEIAARFYGRPSAAMRVIGVTGTNGKTSVVQLLAAALGELGARAATIGTLGAGLVGALVPGERTTPDAIEVQRLLAEFRAAGASHVAMEVSSHALDQGRVNGVDFAVAVFTNLTRDHLDYHGSLAAYGAAKAKLFAWPNLPTAVINSDDPFGRALVTTLPQAVERLRYAIDDATAEIRASAVHGDDTGLRFHLATPWGAGEVAAALLGRFNVYNLLAVAGTLGALGYPIARIREALAALPPVAGRMQRLGGGRVPLVVIDYAHTPDALEQALTAARRHARGHLTCVFGCGGERDRGKRPLMGAIAERLADAVIITDDNPRAEDGDAIVAEILAGIEQRARVRVERDRAAAIRAAIRAAHPGDVVLIAGKGHEPYQEIAGVRHPFDDAEIAQRALQVWSC